MKHANYLLHSVCCFVGMFFLLPFTSIGQHQKLQMPYKKEGLTNNQAAAHLLSRLTFGARPNDVDEVIKMGLGRWVEKQLDASFSNDLINAKLADYETLKMDNETIVNTYLNAGQVVKLSQKAGLLNKDSVDKINKPEYREEIKKLMEQQGLKAPGELVRQTINQKIIRAVYAENQLQELLTDFWFNHFNVSQTKGQSQPYILTYERDAIRPNVMGKFETLLTATAQHPAMLYYLDNATSVSDDNRFATRMMRNNKLGNKNKRSGLNENYAREVMELHTLGVDGGYTQQDVTEVARALTGWTVRPMIKGTAAFKLMDGIDKSMMNKQGFFVQGDFLFRANKHDEGEKKILGNQFPANGGYKEGLEVLHLLAAHPSTAKFICTKLAIRFVSDSPSVALIDKMTEAFKLSKGDIKAVMISMLNSSEFWKKDVVRSKIKSPFELVISAVRATNAKVYQPFQLYNWSSRMGQKFYSYQAPTGFPDNASFWVNSGSLLNRMNFGLAFASQKIPGISTDLMALNNNHEPESVEDALNIFSNLLMPERDQEENKKRLKSMLIDGDLSRKVSEAVNKTAVLNEEDSVEMIQTNTPMQMKPVAQVAHVVGIILGSPEFQRK